jgi:hypothetical protein
MEHRWNEIDKGKPKYSGKILSQRHFDHRKSHMDWPVFEPGASAVRGRRLTAWPMARPYILALPTYLSLQPPPPMAQQLLMG